eukprot:359622-Chlamydomonas_euryale.AAC.6
MVYRPAVVHRPAASSPPSAHRKRTARGSGAAPALSLPTPLCLASTPYLNDRGRFLSLSLG